MSPCLVGQIKPRHGGQRRLGALLFALLLPLLLAWATPTLAAMDYAKQVLIGADFHEADLREVTFSLTNLREANLSEIGRAHV